MASKTEDGHIKTVNNLQLVIEHLNTYGPQYNPSNAAISLAALNAKLAEAQTAMAGHRVIENAYANATDAREPLFDQLPPLSTRIVNALKASGASPLTVNNAQAILRRIRGVRKTRKKKGDISPAPETPAGLTPLPEAQNGAPEAETVLNHSVSNRSHDQLTENFAKLLQVVQDEPLYQPNEVDITVSALQTYVAQLNAHNGTVAGQVASYASSLAGRNAILYAPQNGIPDLAQAVKAYVKSVFGAASVQFKTINAISFRRR